MKQKIILIILILILSISLIACEKKDRSQDLSLCDQLSINLDKNIETNGLINYPNDKIIGGILISASEASIFPLDQDSKKDMRTLSFRGYEKVAILNFKGGKDMVFNYEVGKFYKFNLSNIRLSGALSGTFLDSDLNKLEEMDCSLA